MKRSEVRPGVVAMLSLGGRKGAVRVTVVRGAFTSDPRKQAWVCEDSSGRYRTATPRQLQPMPAPAWPANDAANFEAWRSQYTAG